MLNETERAGRHRYEIDRIVDECFSERVTFKVKSAFQRQKDTPGIKRGVLGEGRQTRVLSWRLFRQSKSLWGIRRALQRGCRKVSDKQGIYKRSQAWEMSHLKKTRRASHNGNGPSNVKILGAISHINSLPCVWSLDLHRWLWELRLWNDGIILSP